MIDLDRWQEIWFTLKQHKLRTTLTAFGVFWGIFMLVILLGAGNGLENGAIKGFGGKINTIYIWVGGKSQIPYKGLPIGRQINLTDQDLAEIKQLPELGLSTSVNNLGGWQVDQYIVRKDKTGTFDTRGIEPQGFLLSGFNLINGRSINDHDFIQRRKVVVIGSGVKEVLFEPYENTVGEQIKIGGINFTIVGVFKTTSNDPNDANMIMMPNSSLRTTFNQMGWIGHFQIAPVDGVHASVLEQKAKAIIMERHKIHPEDRGALGSYNSQKDFDKVTGLFTGIRVFSWLVAIGTIIAGVVGVGNIMLIVVKERTKEIGINKALGATSWHVITTILQETFVLTFFSGYLGLTAGVFLLEAITTVLNNGNATPMFSNAEIDFTTAIIALITLTISSMCAAILPAIKAASVDPIIALQEE